LSARIVHSENEADPPEEVRAVLYVDIPTPADVAALAAARGEACVSICLRTTPLTQQAQADRIELKNVARHALEQLQEAGADKQESSHCRAAR
jgi:hypothetical protein